MKKILFISSLFCAFNLTAQTDLLALYQQVLQDFMAKEPIAFKTNYAFYESLDATEPSHQLTMGTWKKERMNYTVFGDYEILQNESDIVYVDHTSKSIQLLEEEPSVQPINMESFIALVEHLKMEGIQYQTESGLEGIRFFAPPPSRMSVTLEYEAQTGMIDRVLVVYDFSNLEDITYEFDQTKMEVSFSDFQLEHIHIPKNKQAIVHTAGNKTKGIGLYQGYTIY